MSKLEELKSLRIRVAAEIRGAGDHRDGTQWLQDRVDSFVELDKRIDEMESRLQTLDLLADLRKLREE